MTNKIRFSYNIMKNKTTLEKFIHGNNLLFLIFFKIRLVNYILLWYI